MNTDSPVFFVVALQSEATPLIEHYKLRATGHSAFRCFSNGNVSLIVSGIGRINTAAATAALLHSAPSLQRAVCLNTGIAGHHSLPLGQAFVAHRISDAQSGTDWYPQMTFNPACASSALRTVDAPTSDYPQDSGVDMEASAFYPVAIRYLPGELTQVVKVVSDTPEEALDNLDKARVSALMQEGLPAIHDCVTQLQKLAAGVADNTETSRALAEYCKHWHLTQAQKNNLSRLLERHLALFCAIPEAGLFAQEKTAKGMLRALNQRIASRGLHLS
ncbi:hypothetical protein Q4485_00115 [Granulosicoccaceae sp. 1_MG-2023]|nr:hypothetical protein [Granulosicoccaceae sp. 1_MG-2023]